MQNFDHWGIYFIGPFVLEKKKTLSICNYGHRSIHEVSRHSGCCIDRSIHEEATNSRLKRYYVTMDVWYIHLLIQGPTSLQTLING